VYCENGLADLFIWILMGGMATTFEINKNPFCFRVGGAAGQNVAALRLLNLHFVPWNAYNLVSIRAK
jgi:hypothetical protein